MLRRSLWSSLCSAVLVAAVLATTVAQAGPFGAARRAAGLVNTLALPSHYTLERALGTMPAWVPLDVAVDGDGYVYAIDARNSVIKKLPPTGGVAAVTRTFGALGNGKGEFREPGRIGVDSLGYVYVLDMARWDVQKFTRQGVFIRGWRLPYEPRAMTVTSDGRVVVLTANKKILAYSPNGRCLANYSHTGTEAVDVAVDNTGKFYVLDGQPAIYKYGANGTFISKIVDGTYVDNLWDGHLAISGSKLMVASEDGNGSFVTVFSLAGVYQAAYVTFGGGDGQAVSVYGLAADSAGNFYTADVNCARVQKFSATGVYQRQWGYTGTANGSFRGPVGLTLDSAGNLYVADAFNQRIQKFNSAGTYVAKFGTAGSADGQFAMPCGLATGAADSIYATDMLLNRVQKFTSAGAYSAKFGAGGTGNGQFAGPAGIAVAASGAVYVADQGNGRVQYFSAAGAYQGQFGGTEGDYKLDNPWGLAISGGNVFVADDGNCRVAKYGPTGTGLATFGSEGELYGQFQSPKLMATGPDGKVWVADTDSDWAQQFTAAGVFQNALSVATPTRPWPGQLMGIAVGADGKVYLSDIVYQQVYVLAPTTAAAPARPVAIASLRAASTATGAQIVFSLSAEAEVDVAVTNVAGRPIRTVALGRACAAGSNTLLWDGRNQAGLKLPAGSYLVRLVAHGAGGQQAASLTRLNLGR